MTNAYIDAGDDNASKLQTYKNTVSGNEVHSEAVTPTDQNGVPFTSSNPFAVSMQQIPDSGNSALRTVANGATQFVGTWYLTRSAGIVRQLVVLASNVTSGLGGTFVFEYGEDGATAVISESRPITSFATVRDFNLINAGAYFRVKFTPSRALTGAEFVAITTTQRRQNDGEFVRLADQQIEKQNAAMSQTFAYAKGFGLDGVSKDVPVNSSITNSPATAALGGGATYTSDWYNLAGFESLAALIGTNQISTTNGIDLQFSDDGVTVRSHAYRTFSATDVSFGSKFFGVPMRADYVRLVYNNGASAQGSFFVSLEAIVQPSQGSDTLEGAVSASSTAVMDRSILIAKDPTAGNYDNITRTTINAANQTGEHVGIVKHEVDTPIKALTSWTHNQTTIASATVAAVVVPSPTSGRKTVAVKGLSTNTKVVFLGKNGSVTSSTGWELAAGETIVLEVDDTAAVYVVGSTAASQTVCWAEVA